GEAVVGGGLQYRRGEVSLCEHKNDPHYGKGYCRTCYMREYHRLKRKTHGQGTFSVTPLTAPQSSSQPNSAGPGAGETQGLVAGPEMGPDPLCGECGQTEVCWKKLIFCEGCDSTHHLACLSMKEQPWGEWYCRRCQDLMVADDSDPEMTTDTPPQEDTLRPPQAKAPRGRHGWEQPTPPSTGETSQDERDSGPVEACPSEDKTLEGGPLPTAAPCTLGPGGPGHRPRSPRVAAAGAKLEEELARRGVKGCRCPDCVSVILATAATALAAAVARGGAAALSG
ncbi:unnamed protein product, partial [Discosporangium mesarthrocarpum]